MTNLDDSSESLETIQDFIRWGGTIFRQENLFFGHGTDNAFDDAKMLVLHVLSLPWDLPEIYYQSRLTKFERTKVIALFYERIHSRKPSAYLVGKAWFAGMEFNVNENVLVPRSPIAELISQKFSPWIDNPEKVTRILDMCTGSGCIGIASLQAFVNAEVDLVDISPEALMVARSNVNHYGLGKFAHVIESDLYSALEEKKYDLIISNPPYVDKIEMQDLPAEFHQEPRLGLEAGDDGLDLVRVIVAQAANYLTEDGVLVVEVGVSQFYMQQAYPELPLYWFEFENGGEGVFAISKSELDVYQDFLNDRVD